MAHRMTDKFKNEVIAWLVEKPSYSEPIRSVRTMRDWSLIESIRCEYRIAGEWKFQVSVNAYLKVRLDVADLRAVTIDEMRQVVQALDEATKDADTLQVMINEYVSSPEEEA